MIVDFRKAEVTREGAPVDLSAKEFQLLTPEPRAREIEFVPDALVVPLGTEAP